MKTILAADIGGTSSRFAAFEAGPDGSLSLRERRRFRTGDARSFGHLLEMLHASGFPLPAAAADIAVVAAPGPVLEGVFCSPPFVPWAFDFSRAAEEYGFRRWALVNDFIAQAYATQSPAAAAATAVLPGRAVAGSAVAIVGAGTGLGQALLVPDGRGGHVAVPSEGGHADFPLVGREERELGDFLTERLGVERVTSVHVVSGAGLANIHWYLTGRRLPPEEVPAELAAGTPSLALASRLYARACRLFVLQGAAFGGLYVAGGVAARTPALVTDAAFEREFRAPGAMAGRMREVPVFLVADEESGLWGAAEIGRRELAAAPAAG